MAKQKNSTFSKITKIVVWIMLIVMVGAVVASAFISLASV